MDLDSPATRDEVAKYLEEHHLVEIFGELGGIPDLNELTVKLVEVRAAEDGVYVDCHLNFHETVRVGPGGASHDVQRSGLVHLRLDPKTGQVLDSWLR